MTLSFEPSFEPTDEKPLPQNQEIGLQETGFG